MWQKSRGTQVWTIGKGAVVTTPQPQQQRSKAKIVGLRVVARSPARVMKTKSNEAARLERRETDFNTNGI